MMSTEAMSSKDDASSSSGAARHRRWAAFPAIVCLAASMLLIACIGPSSVARADPGNANCKLKTPPAESGEDGVHRRLMKIFPRASAIDATYNGCQTVWIEDEGKWIVFMIARFKNGVPVEMRMPMAPDERTSVCQVLPDGSEKGDCHAMRMYFPYSSAAPQCASAGKGADENGACEYD